MFGVIMIVCLEAVVTGLQVAKHWVQLRKSFDCSGDKTRSYVHTSVSKVSGNISFC
jgi:hypothetical protein